MLKPVASFTLILSCLYTSRPLLLSPSHVNGPEWMVLRQKGNLAMTGVRGCTTAETDEGLFRNSQAKSAFCFSLSWSGCQVVLGSFGFARREEKVVRLNVLRVFVCSFFLKRTASVTQLARWGTVWCMDPFTSSRLTLGQVRSMRSKSHYHLMPARWAVWN